MNHEKGVLLNKSFYLFFLSQLTSKIQNKVGWKICLFLSSYFDKKTVVQFAYVTMLVEKQQQLDSEGIFSFCCSD